MASGNESMVRDSVLHLVVRRQWELAVGIAVSSIAVLVLQRAFQWNAAFFLATVVWLALTAVSPLILAHAMTHVERLHLALAELSHDPRQAEAWSRATFAELLSNRTLGTCGLTLALLGLAATEILQVPWSGVIRALFFALIAVFFFNYGVLGGIYIAACRWVLRLEEVPVRKTILGPMREVRRIYSALFGLLILGSILYAAAVTTVWVSPGGEFIATQTMWGRLWVFPPAVAIIGFFLLFHTRLHIVLSNSRDLALSELDDRITRAYSEWTSNAAETAQISALLDWRDRVAKQPVWPLDLKVVLATILTLLIPTAEAIVRVLT